MTTSTANTMARCTMQSHRVEICRVPLNGTYAVGCNGRLIGHYADADAAIFAAREHVRMLAAFQHELPRVSRSFIAAVESL
jgi:hypothetical protein